MKDRIGPPRIVRVFAERTALIEELTEKLFSDVSAVTTNGRCALALSGGSTPEAFYRYLAGESLRRSFPWRLIDVFWSDERWVPHDHPESNFRMATDALLAPIRKMSPRVYPVDTASTPELETARYEKLLRDVVRKDNDGMPTFDWLMLGIGTDGHTASLFPGGRELEERDRLVTSSCHPDTGQRRVTLTIPLINSAKQVIFVATGEEKADIVARVLNEPEGTGKVPAAMVRPPAGQVYWFIDRAAARLLQAPW